MYKVISMFSSIQKHLQQQEAIKRHLDTSQIEPSKPLVQLRPSEIAKKKNGT